MFLSKKNCFNSNNNYNETRNIITNLSSNPTCDLLTTSATRTGDLIKFNICL